VHTEIIRPNTSGLLPQSCQSAQRREGLQYRYDIYSRLKTGRYSLYSRAQSQKKTENNERELGKQKQKCSEETVTLGLRGVSREEGSGEKRSQFFSLERVALQTVMCL